MKKYFAKYLPVEGEIKPGDKFSDNQLGICIRGKENPWVEWKGGITNLVIDEDHRKVKLFLCSRDIQVGDKVKTEGIEDRELKYIDKTGTLFFTNGDDCEPTVCFKVIGEISPEATWIKEGDEFDGYEIWNRNIDTLGDFYVKIQPHMWDKPRLKEKGWEKDVIRLECPTCKKFH